ncbi:MULTISPECIES: hypothetical protein [Enterococcus]|uniref:hypothetical protein n=1 Tax=Enterococcus TaxID=1350 RepID=UPI00065E3DA0|nr:MULTISPECIES: hypothetical protein [Enterococcus]KAF1303858.1 hypothetical protein BAU16_03225 [Enterococcus sp. JM9B]
MENEKKNTTISILIFISFAGLFLIQKFQHMDLTLVFIAILMVNAFYYTIRAYQEKSVLRLFLFGISAFVSAYILWTSIF